MAAPTVVAASTDAQWDVDGNITAGLPAGLQSGDLLILLVMVRNGGQTINLVSGYTLVSGDNVSLEAAVTGEIQAKIAGSSESGPNVVTSQTATQPTGAVLVAVRGAAAIASMVVSAAANGASATMVAPTVTTATADNLVLRLYLNADDNIISTPPASHSQVFTGSTALGSDAAMHIYSITQASVGATGTASLVVVGADAYQAWTLAIPPAANVVNLVGAIETNAGGALTRTKNANLTGAVEADLAAALTRTKSLPLLGAVETDTAGGITISTPPGPTPAERTYTVPAEDRTCVVAAEDRTLTVPAEDRTLTVAR